jgi:hypothetical protein
MKKLLIFLILATQAYLVKSQTIPHPIRNQAVYDYLDEMAGLQHINLNTVVKPYSRMFIAQKLKDLDRIREDLTRRQEKELDFYLRDFGKELQAIRPDNKRLDLFYHADSLFKLTINPILGVQVHTTDSASVLHRWNGIEAWATLGKHLSAYASLRDNYHSKRWMNEQLVSQAPGVNYKHNGDGGDFSEMKAGLYYTWDWGSLGAAKDDFRWGEGYAGTNIFSGRPPSFAHLALHLKPVDWFEFHWVHGWLVSEVVDSSLSYTFTNSYGTTPREVFYDKYLAANLFTFQPIKHLYFSVGNSVIYSHLGPQLQYMIPVMFYKSVDHTYNATDSQGRNVGQNSQLFFSFSSKNIRKVHLYSTLFLDELAVSRWFKEDEHNFWSLKAGARLYGLPANTTFTAEYTKTMPLVYRHHIATTTFRSNGYNLGSFMQDNVRQWYFALTFYPARGLHAKVSYQQMDKGPDYTAMGVRRVGNPFLSEVRYTREVLALDLRYQPWNDVFLTGRIGYEKNTGPDMHLYVPEYAMGEQMHMSVGVNVGF